MPNHIYRFRSVTNLRKFNELNSQEFYVAHPSELNDPMEGYKHVFWYGDRILWENLLKHYMLCLTGITVFCQEMADDEFRAPQIPVLLTEDDFPSDAFRTTYRTALNEFLTLPRTRQVLELLVASKFPVQREQLSYCLFMIHAFAMQAVRNAFVQSKQLRNRHSQVNSVADSITDALSELASAFEKLDDNENVASAWFRVAESRNRGIRLAFLHSKLAGLSKEKLRKCDWLQFCFSDEYVDALGSLIHPDWYTVCFSGTCENASLWSTYAEHHRGVVLMFRTEENKTGKPGLRIKAAIGAGGTKESTCFDFDTRHCPLYQVRYTSAAPRVNFFPHIAGLPIDKIRKTWHSDEKGRISPLVDKIYQDESAWRQEHWEYCYQSATTKLSDWEHEEELRLVFSDSLGLFKQNRKVTYDFSSLAGMVFGLRTAEHDKLAILEIIERKCMESNRSDFQFFETQYSPSTSKLIVVPIHGISFASSKSENPEFSFPRDLE